MDVEYNARFRTAVADITCYKVIFHDIEKGIYMTPYTKTPINLRKALVAEGDVEIIRGTHPAYMVKENVGGLIHVYTTRENVKNFPTMTLHTDGLELWECVIPKGTRYIMSIDNKEIGTKEVLFIKQIH